MPSYEDYPEAPNDLAPTLGFVCPLFRELAAVRAIFDEQFKPKPKYQDGDLECEYHYGRIASRDVVAVSFADKRVGPRWAVAHAERLLERHPSLKEETSSYFLVGIAAGIPSQDEDIRLGDVVVATQVVDWTDGKKKTGDEFEATEHAESASNHVLNKVAGFCDNEKRLGERIQQKVEAMQPVKPEDKVLWHCPGLDQDILFQPDVVHEDGDACENCAQRIEERKPRDPYLPKVHRGLIAAGNIVLKDATTREKLRNYEKNKVLAVEMEASGVMTASKRFIIIRGICDYGDSHKNKQWQHYAAANAAACARLWIDDCLPTNNSKQRKTDVVSDDSPEVDADQRKAPHVPNLDKQHATGTREDSNSPGSGVTTVSHSMNDSGRDSKYSTDDANNESDNSRSPSAGKKDSSIRSGDEGAMQRESHPPRASISTDGWTTLADIRASAVVVSLRNGIEREGTKSEWTLIKYEQAGIRFEVRMTRLACKATRRLIISNLDDSQVTNNPLWIPNTQVRVARSGEKLNIKFSDCNQAMKKTFGRFDTNQGRAYNTTGYDPETPNVKIDIFMDDVKDITELGELILSRHQQLVPDAAELNQNPHGYTVTYCSDGAQANAVCVWHKGREDEIFDLASFSTKIDFEICVNEVTYIRLGYMDKFSYKPVTDEPYPRSDRPPKAVRENNDGGPGFVDYTGGELLSNTMDMVASNEDEIGKLLTRTVGDLVGWTMKALALEVDVTGVKRLRHNYPVGPSQLSVWTNGHDLRFLINTKKSTKQGKDTRWIACTIPQNRLDRGSDDNGPSFSIEGDQEAVLECVEFQAGDYISPTTFLPESDASNRRGGGPDWRAIELKFDGSGSRRSFEQSLSRIKAEASQV